MSKASQNIALVLIPLGLIFLGFQSCDRDGRGATRRSTGRSFFFGPSFSSFHGSSRSGSGFSSGIHRGGFGSHGGHIGG